MSPDDYLQSLNAHYLAILRRGLTTFEINNVIESEDNLAFSHLPIQFFITPQTDTSLLSRAQNTTIPALVSYDVFFGATPWSGGLDFITNYASSLLNQGFSQQNVYVNLGASFIIASPQAAQYASQDRSTFLNNAYTNVFGYGPSQDAANYLLSTFDFYQSFTGSDLGAKGAIYGWLLWASNTGTGAAVGQYEMQAEYFLRAAANSNPLYGQPLSNLDAPFPAPLGGLTELASGGLSLESFPNTAGSVVEGGNVTFTLNSYYPATHLPYIITGPGASQVQGSLSGDLVVDQDGNATLNVSTLANVFDGSRPTITLTINGAGNTVASNTVTIRNLENSVTTINVTGSNQVIDPGAGTGNHVIQFIGASNDSLVLHTGSIPGLFNALN